MNNMKDSLTAKRDCRYLTPEMDAEIAADYLDGLGVIRICLRHRIGWMTLWRALARHGVDVRHGYRQKKIRSNLGRPRPHKRKNPLGPGRPEKTVDDRK